MNLKHLHKIVTHAHGVVSTRNFISLARMGNQSAFASLNLTVMTQRVKLDGLLLLPTARWTRRLGLYKFVSTLSSLLMWSIGPDLGVVL